MDQPSLNKKMMTYDIKVGKRIDGKIEFLEEISSSIGIFEKDAIKGNTTNVSISGIYKNKDLNLAPGKVYYSDKEGNLTTSKVELETIVTTDYNYGIDIIESIYLKVGKSISSDKVLLSFSKDSDYRIGQSQNIAFPASQNIDFPAS